MHIVILGPAHPLRGGGMTTFNERMAHALQDAGHSVIIYSFALQYPGFLFPGSSQYTSEPAPPGLTIISAVNSINPANWITVGNELKKMNPDLIIVRYWLPLMGPSLGTILRRVKKNKHTKVICLADNVIPHEKRPGDKLFTKYFVKPIDAFITMSENVLSDLKKFSQKPAFLTEHPLYDNFGEKLPQKEARKELQLANDDFILLFFGFIRKYKGLDILLEAMPEIIKNIPSAKLLIAGEFYGDSSFYDVYLNDKLIRDHLSLHTNFIEASQVKKYFCAADVVVQPYRNATQSGVTPLAYHFEIPMIVTNVGGLPRLVPNDVSGLVAEPDAASIAKKVVEYYHKGVEHFLPGLREQKKKYSWEKMVEEIESIYKKI